ncbi:hypothetical protein EJ110_NYTH33206 [Nymphaea thermarum]|nr:hypothetical protein EJ110_NYTH33206 [Nymphaea thermarum]
MSRPRRGRAWPPVLLHFIFYSKTLVGQCKNILGSLQLMAMNMYALQCDEKAMMKVVARQPLSVCTEASKDFLMNQSVSSFLVLFNFTDISLKGIFKGKCGTNLNHAVAIVGHETENEMIGVRVDTLECKGISLKLQPDCVVLPFVLLTLSKFDMAFSKENVEPISIVQLLLLGMEPKMI